MNLHILNWTFFHTPHKLKIFKILLALRDSLYYSSAIAKKSYVNGFWGHSDPTRNYYNFLNFQMILKNSFDN
jgi:hypothetical protein